jgi:MFS transporter, DHA2 family, multidrug resistance protein
MSVAPDFPNRLPITISIMLATTMNTLDTTIANVALPHIQGSVQAGPEQIVWVLTSYIIAAAIMTPLTGWIAGRVGRKRLFLFSICGFVIASMLCGIATSLPELVAYRLFQGVCGAALMPLSQAVLLDINPPERHGQAMAIFGAGVILGPILGPVVGGYLTEYLSWRWCFYINLPIGILSLIGVWLFIPGDPGGRSRPFDFLGFGALALFIGSFQLMLDRGPGKDWFYSTEIWIEAVLALIGLWIFAIHTMTAEHPFVERALFRDHNFRIGTLFGFFVGILLYSAMALLPPLMQNLLGYPVLTAGIVSMPRGIGSFLGMIVVGRLIGRVDTRLLLLLGLALSAVAFWPMQGFDLSMPDTPLVVSGLLQGFGIGMIFVPLSTLAFATVSPQLRAEGAAVNTLVRNIGSSVGISIMQALVVANSQAMHGSLAAHVVPSDAVVADGLDRVFGSLGSFGLPLLNAEITRQATMVAYVDAFRLMLFIAIACMPVVFVLRPPRPAPGVSVRAPVE